jgi:hypothetical protein
VVNGACVRAGVNIPERDKSLGVDVDAYLLTNLAAGSRSEVGIFNVRAAAGKNESAGIIAEMVGTATEIDLDASLSVANERDCGRRYWFFALRHRR